MRAACASLPAALGLLAECKALFDAADSDESGLLDPSEIASAFQQLHKRGEEEKQQNLVVVADPLPLRRRRAVQ